MEAAAARPVIRVAAICGSLRKASFNGGLLRAAAEVCEESIPELRVDHVDISGLPLLNTDLETDGGFPPAVEAFREKVRQADCFLFGSPEYNYSIATPLKNALDWASRGKNCWADKPAAIVSAGGGFGGGRSQYHLRQVGVFLDLHFINKPELFVKAFEQPPKFDGDGLVTSVKDKYYILPIPMYYNHDAHQYLHLEYQLGHGGSRMDGRHKPRADIFLFKWASTFLNREGEAFAVSNVLACIQKAQSSIR
uniref:NAD(P)H dehydrogenase (quinone) n=1 Tax=Leersia perrieri TaxID=77586 RepID=A0A0D9VAB8_9ORYZ